MTNYTFAPGEFSEAQLLLADICPAAGYRHILTLGNGWLTALDLFEDGCTYGIEHPPVIGELLRIIKSGEEGSVILRTFTDEISDTLTNGTRIPVKEVRGWYVEGGRLHPFTDAEIFSASCTDATGEPIPPEDAVRYVSARELP